MHNFEITAVYALDFKMNFTLHFIGTDSAPPNGLRAS